MPRLGYLGLDNGPTMSFLAQAGQTYYIVASNELGSFSFETGTDVRRSSNLSVNTSEIPPSSGSAAGPSLVTLQPDYNFGPNLYTGLTGGLITAPGSQCIQRDRPRLGCAHVELNNSAAFSSNRSANTQDDIKKGIQAPVARGRRPRRLPRQPR